MMQRHYKTEVVDQSNNRGNNIMPNWLNIILVICIFISLIYCTQIFLKDFKLTGQTQLETFLPACIFIVFWFLTMFLTRLFANADLAKLMMVTLLIIGLIVVSVGFYTEDEYNKSASIHIGAAILGLALGIPFGDHLRKD